MSAPACALARAPVITLALVLALVAPATAQPNPRQSIRIDHPVIRVAYAGAKTGAGYMVIRNTGTRPDRLLSVTTAASARADLHGTVAQGNIMEMRVKADGVPVPAGGSIFFAPGGLHVMFIGLKHAMPEDSVIKARLLFQHAGAIDVSFKAEFAATAK